MLGVEEREGSWIIDFSGAKIVPWPISNDGVEEGGGGTKEIDWDAVSLMLLLNEGEGGVLLGLSVASCVCLDLDAEGLFELDATPDLEKLVELLCEVLGVGDGQKLAVKVIGFEIGRASCRERV